MTTGLLIFIVAQTFTAVWWAATLTAEQNHLINIVEAKTADRFTGSDGTNLQLQIDNNKGDILEIKALLIRIDGKIDKL